MIKIPITLIATIRLKEGSMEKVKEALKEIVPKIKESEPGCLHYIPHTVKGEDNLIVFYEVYADSNALKIHNENLRKNTAKLAPFLEGGAEVKVCFEIL